VNFFSTIYSRTLKAIQQTASPKGTVLLDPQSLEIEINVMFFTIAFANSRS
jgi:hypothetical protein